MYSYNDGSLWVINSMYTAVRSAGALRVSASDVNGTMVFAANYTIPALPGDTPIHVGDFPPISRAQLSTATYVLQLTVSYPATSTSSGIPPSNPNTYWLSTTPDVLEWEKSNFYITPCSSYADLSGLCALAPAKATWSVSHVLVEGTVRFNISLVNPAGAPIAFAGHITCWAGATELRPILFSDNFVTLLPGHSRLVSATFQPPVPRRQDIEGEGGESGYSCTVDFYNDVC